MNIIVSIIAFAMLAMVMKSIIRSLSANRNAVAEKPVEETSEMKLRRAYRNAYFMQISLADEAKKLSEKQRREEENAG